MSSDAPTPAGASHSDPQDASAGTFRPGVQVVEDARYQAHRGPDEHPERPERLRAIGQALDAFRPGRPGSRNALEIVSARAASPEEILRVHERRMLDQLAATQGGAPGRLDADTYFCSASFEIARLAAGGSIDLARRAARGEVRCGLAAVRPPGHHAEAHRAMGFCLFNNVAIAARALQAEEGHPRILIFDWDVHHGNGTQHTFESDPDVFYISTHQFPFYPGTGDFAEAGSGAGLGRTLNIPMPAGCGDAEYLGVVQRLVVPAAQAFRPDLMIVSCGFDAHRDDPLASMEVGFAGYQGMAALMRQLADTLCDGRIVYVLEGGYALSGVREGARAVLESLTASAAPKLPAPIEMQPGSILRRIVDGVVEVHGRSIPGLGAS